MKKTILFAALALISFQAMADKKTTTSATISFDATTAKDDKPKADNKTAIGSLDTRTGSVAFEATIKNFSFENPMMQEHFNGEHWMNSDKFPKATFKGKITNLSAIDFKKDGTYTANVAGDLTIHGKTNPVTTTATVTVSGGTISTESKFDIVLKKFGIEVPSMAAGKVAEEPKIMVSSSFK